MMQRLYASVDGGSRRRLMSRHLSGEGIELGPGHHPLAAPDGAKVRYVDRWSAADAAVLFPEVADGFIDPDVLVDFNAEGLAPIDDASQDFVIASHVLEHLANPLRMLCEIHRVLRPGGVALILLPDRTRVKGDKLRPATPLEHVVGEYDAGVTEIAPAHIFEVLAASGEQIPDERSERDALVELHRTRSVHAHCWNEDDFAEVIRYSVSSLGLGFELVDAVVADATQPGEANIEYGFVLRRTSSGLAPDVLARRWTEFWAEWKVQEAVSRAYGRRALWAILEKPAIHASLGSIRRATARLRPRTA